MLATSSLWQACSSLIAQQQSPGLKNNDSIVVSCTLTPLCRWWFFRVRRAERLSTSFGPVAAKRKGQAEIFAAILSLRLWAWQGLKGRDHFTVWQVLFPLALGRPGQYGPRQAVIWLRKARRSAQRPLIHHIVRRRAFIPTARRTWQTADSFDNHTCATARMENAFIVALYWSSDFWVQIQK